jgi:hypothetical protein
MKWFRSNIKHGLRLALLALAIQFVLSFGHHHGTAALAASSISMQASDAGGTKADKTIAARDASVGDSANASATRPSEPASGHGQDDDYCAVCAIMALVAGSAMFTGPPVLLLPDAYHFLFLTTEAEFKHLESRRVIFQPRAPPSS